jgi:hypothetical protein
MATQYTGDPWAGVISNAGLWNVVFLLQNGRGLCGLDVSQLTSTTTDSLRSALSSMSCEAHMWWCVCVVCARACACACV